MTTRNIKSILDGNSALASLARKAELKSNLDDRIRQHLPEALADIIAAVHVDEASSCLMVTADTGERASRLRYAQADLLAAAAQAGAAAKRCKFKVRPVRRMPESGS
ncbi:MAG: DciA family protein [Pseudomonadota bacterium]